MTYRNRALLDLCHEAPCLLLPGQHQCTGPSEPAHSDMIRHGRGEHHKSHDCFAVPGCHNAHLAFTRANLGKEGYHAAWTEAMERYILWLWVSDRIRLTGSPNAPREHSMEAPMCKICEHRHYVRDPHTFGTNTNADRGKAPQGGKRTPGRSGDSSSFRIPAQTGERPAKNIKPKKKAKKEMSWIGGLAQWDQGPVTYLSVAFSWKLGEAYSRALFAGKCGQTVIAGGPALFLPQMQKILEGVASVQKHHPDALIHHNPEATIASRGCPVGCSFCIVPAMEGKEFTLLPEFTPRPILCDNNLSALPAAYQRYIIERYRGAGVKLIDANSGFEPLTFNEEVYRRWAPLVNEGGGPWRFAYDELAERDQVHRVMKMLESERAKRKRVYVLIGNEPYADCMRRIQEVLDNGCEPYVQALMKLNALEREPHVRFDWTAQKLKNVERWANKWVWKKGPFEDYDRFFRSNAPRETYDQQQGLFV